MALLKTLEHWAKLTLAAALAVLLFRPWRHARLSAVSQARRVLLVRLDPRVGEVLLTTPLVNRLHAAHREVHLLVHPTMLRVVDGLPGVTRAWPFRKTLASLRALRAEQFDAVINCGNWETPAVTSAIAARLIAGRGVAVGPATQPTAWLMDRAVSPLEGERSEVVQRAHLIDSLRPGSEPLRLSFREPRPNEVVQAFMRSLTFRFAVVNPGGRLGARRVPPSAFVAGCEVMVQRGLTPVVTWGPGEEALADEVCRACPQAVRAVATDLDGLAALLRAAQMTLCNNTGPMHLAVAVKSPTLALFSRIDMARWSHPGPPHRAIDVTSLLESPQLLEERVAQTVDGFLRELKPR